MKLVSLVRYVGLVGALTIVVGATLFVGISVSGGCIEYDFNLGNSVEYGREFEQALPQWSPDGTLTVLSHDQVVYTKELDGPGLRRVTRSRDDDWHDVAQSPSISPDGSRIAYAAFKHDSWPWGSVYRWDIVTSGLDGSDRRRLTKSASIWVVNMSPAWSPDGSRIAFVSNRTGLKDEGGRERIGAFAVYTMATDGSDVRSVATGVAAEGTTPLWSPDGRSLAFVALEPDSPDPVHGTWYDSATKARYTVKEVLYTVGADGSGLTRLGETAGYPSWSRDGGRIAFARSDGDTHVAIVTTDPDGSNEKKVFESSEVRTTGFIDVSWSPDGTRIAITGLVIPWENRPYFGGEGNAVSIVGADGSGRPRLIDAIWLKPRGVSWSPDSSRIAVYIPGNHSPGGALKTMAAVELPEQDEYWYRWDEGEGGRYATPNPSPTLAQTLPSTPTPAPTTTSSLIREPGFQTTPACAGDSDASCTPRDVSGFGLFSAGGAAGPEPVAASSLPPR